MDTCPVKSAFCYTEEKNRRGLCERISAGRPKSWSWSFPLSCKGSEYRSHHEHSLLSTNDLKYCGIQSPAFQTVWSVLYEFSCAKELYGPVWIAEMVALSTGEGDGWLDLRWFFIAQCPSRRLVLTLILTLPLLGEKGFGAEVTTDQRISVQFVHRKKVPEPGRKYLISVSQLNWRGVYGTGKNTFIQMTLKGKLFKV